MDRKTNSLLIKSNRLLGTRIVAAGLASVEDMDRANEAFIEFARAKDLKHASLLRIMVYDHQSLREESLLDYQLEHYPVGAIMLENYQINEEALEGIPLELIRASWTLPVARIGERWFLATAYYMSESVRSFWEELLGGRITWYLSSIGQMEAVFDRLEEARAAIEAAARTQPETTPEEA